MWYEGRNMKWLILTLLSGAAWAAPVGNTSAPELIEEGFFIPPDSWIDLRAGYEGDFVSDARLKQIKQGNGRVDDYKQNANSGTFTFNILDRLDVFGVFGSSRVWTDWRFDDPAGDTHRAELETLYDFLWAVGARGILFEWGCSSVGLGGRYEQSHYDNLWLTIDGASQPTSGTHLHWREWQVNLDVSYKIDIFTPYVGVKYSNTRAKIGTFDTPIANNLSGSNTFENRTPVGVYIGCALSTGRYFFLNVEGRLVDEEAVTISGDLRF